MLVMLTTDGFTRVTIAATSSVPGVTGGVANGAPVTCACALGAFALVLPFAAVKDLWHAVLATSAAASPIEMTFRFRFDIRHPCSILVFFLYRQPLDVDVFVGRDGL